MESINIYNVNGQSLMSVGIGQDCVYHNELQGDEYVALRWESDEYQALPVGAYVNYNGRNFRLVEPCEPTRKTEFVYTYEPTFYATHCAWKKVQACYYEYLNSGITITNNTTTHKVSINVTTSVSAREMDWSFTGNLPDALAMVLQSIYNETGLSVEFAYAEEIGNKLIELTAQGLSVYDMIEQLSEQCGKEWWVEYSQTTPVIHLATLEKTATPSAQNVDENGVVLLNVGTDITNPSVQTNKDDYFTRFYFFGSNRNIQQSESITNSAVVNKRLTLNPKHQTETGYTTLNHYPQGFIDINANITPDTDTNYQPTLASSEIFSKSVFFEDIYPRANYKVKEVKFANIDVEDDTGKKTGEQLPIYFVTLYDANDAQHTAIGFNDWVGENASHVMGDMVAGLVPSIAFRGGYLQGLEFELIIHKAGTTTRGVTFASDYFEIAFDQNSNPRLPNATIKPIANDDCTLFNVRMPNKYILNAYHELEAKALEYIEDAKTDKATYDITCNPIKFESVPALASLNIGYKSAIIYPNSARTDSRVIMIEKHLDIESDIKLQLGYRKTAGSIKTLQEVVTSTQDNVEKVVKTADYNRNKMIAMRTNLNAQREALDNVFDPDGYFDSDKIRPMSIETQMLAVGAKSQQFAITGSSFKLPDYSSGHGILTWTAGTLSHFTIDESGVKNWTISAGTQTLANGNLYYVYAKCGKANTSATIVAEQTQRKFDADATYYYFLIGTISSESQDADNHLWGRVLTFTYGSAQINGREITAGVIKGGAGAHSVKIDLEEGVIEGNIKLTAGDTDNASIINSLIGANSSTNKYGTCSTGASTTAKVVTLTQGSLSTLTSGTTVSVHFTYGNTASNPTLNVAGTGAKAIKTETGSFDSSSNWGADATIQFTYNGTYWIMSSALSANSTAQTASARASSAVTTAEQASTKASSAVTTAGQASTKAQNALNTANGIEVGGTNLLSVNPSVWARKTVTESRTDYPYYTDMLLDTTTRITITNLISINSNSIAVSVYSEGINVFITCFNASGNYFGPNYKIPSSWLSGKHTYDVTGVKKILVTIRKTDNSVITPADVESLKIKIELGNKATDWTPAPEDVQEGIDLSNLQGTCSSHAGAHDTDKVYDVVCPEFKPAFLKKGTRIKVSFTFANTGAPNGETGYLNINSTGNHRIKWQGNVNNKPIWSANDDIVPFAYDGSYWIIEDEEQRLMRAIYTEAVNGATSINGGLVLTKVIQCGEGAMQSGMSGVSSNDIAFWAGGTPTSDKTPVRIFRNGKAFFGRLFLKGNKGNIGFNDNNGNEMWELVSNAVPTNYTNQTFTLNDSTGRTQTFTNASVVASGYSDYWRSLGTIYSVTIPARTRGAKLSFDMSGSLTQSGNVTAIAVGLFADTSSPNPQAEIDAFIVKTMAGLTSVTIEEQAYTYSFPYSASSTTYYILLYGRTSATTATVSGSIRVRNLVGTSVNMITTMGNNGMLIAYNANNYFTAFIANNIMNVKAHGNFDLPGVLFAGQIMAAGGIQTIIFKNSAVNVSLSSASGGVYTYTITGATNVLAMSIPFANSTNNYRCAISAQSSTSVTVRCYNGTSASMAFGFNLILLGTT